MHMFVPGMRLGVPGMRSGPDSSLASAYDCQPTRKVFVPGTRLGLPGMRSRQCSSLASAYDCQPTRKAFVALRARDAFGCAREECMPGVRSGVPGCVPGLLIIFINTVSNILWEGYYNRINYLYTIFVEMEM